MEQSGSSSGRRKSDGEIEVYSKPFKVLRMSIDQERQPEEPTPSNVSYMIVTDNADKQYNLVPIVSENVSSDDEQDIYCYSDADYRNMKLEDILKLHGLHRYWHVLSSSHNVATTEIFAEMQPEDVPLFCHIIADRINFRKLVGKLKQIFTSTEKHVTTDLPVDNEMIEKFSDLRQYLAKRADGKAILANYENSGELTNSLRNDLVKMILLEAVNNKIKIDARFNMILTDKIVSLFPNEKSEIYYRAAYTTPDGKRVAASGKFIKRKTVELKSLKVGESTKATNKTAEEHKRSNVLTDERQISARQWLVHGRDPTDMLRQQWELCYELRKLDIEGCKDLANIFNLYPVLKDPRGGFLLSLDFDAAYPEATKNFYLRFPKLHVTLQSYLKTVPKDEHNAARYVEYCGSENQSYRDFLLCSLLPLILKTNYRVKGLWRPSTKESQKGFILEVETPSDVRRQVEERLIFLKSKMDTVAMQPQIVVVGNLQKNPAFLVMFGGAEYKADTLLHALCLCMHVTFVLNLQYAPDCKAVWVFLQVHLFKIFASVLEMPKATKDLLRILGE